MTTSEIEDIQASIERLRKKIEEYRRHISPDQINIFTGELEHPDTRWHKEMAELQRELNKRLRAMSWNFELGGGDSLPYSSLKERVLKTLEVHLGQGLSHGNEGFSTDESYSTRVHQGTLF